MTIGISPMLARGIQYSSGTPMFWNVYDFAYSIKYDDAHCMMVGDSINTDETSAATMPPGYRDAWRPNRWKGWYSGSAINFLNYASVNLTAVLGFEGRDATYSRTNRWVMTSGTRAIDYSGAVPDTAVQQVSGVTATNFSPNAYREIVCKGPANGDAAAAGNFPNGTAVQGWGCNHDNFERFNSTAQPSETATSGGNWTVGGGALTARMIYFRNTNGPSNWKFSGYRNGGLGSGTETTFDANGSESIQYVECTIAAYGSSTSDANSRIRPSIFSTGATDESDKCLPVLGCLVWDPNVTGLIVSRWANAGWNSTHFVDTALVSDTHLAAWLAAINWPTHLYVQVGQNQTAGEQTELNAGTYTTYKANIEAMLDRILALYTAASRRLPRVCLVAPYDTSQTATNYATMATALYLIAQARGYAFINLPALMLCPRGFASTDATTVLARGGGDDVHPSLTGAQYFATLTWTVFETAIAAGRNSYR